MLFFVYLFSVVCKINVMAGDISGGDGRVAYLSGALPKWLFGICGIIHFSTDTEVQVLMDGISSIRFTFYQSKNLIVPSTFSRQDLLLKRRNAYCFDDDLLYLNKEWLIKESAVPESEAV